MYCDYCVVQSMPGHIPFMTLAWVTEMMIMIITNHPGYDYSSPSHFFLSFGAEKKNKK